MSDIQGNINSDEEKYANDSFETDLAESSVYGSDTETSERERGRTLVVSKEQTRSFTRNTDFWTCESSSDEDDVVLGHTIAEINTNFSKFTDGNLPLTPAARMFQMASTKLNKSPRSKDITDVDDEDEDDDDDLTECGDFGGDIIDNIDEIDSVIMSTENNAKNPFQQYTKYSTTNDILYEDHIMFETSGIDVNEVYSDIGTENGGEVDIGEPYLDEELGEEEEPCFEDEPIDEEGDDGNSNYSNVDTGINDDSGDDDYDEKTLEASSLAAQSIHEDIKIDTKSEARSEAKSDTKSDTKSNTRSEAKSLRTDDSMEDFKRKVMLSHRMRCASDGSGDYTRSKSRKSFIPVWIGSNELLHKMDTLKSSYSAPGVRPMIPKIDARSHNSLPDFSDTDTLMPNENDYDDDEDGAFGVDSQAGGDYNDLMTKEDFQSEYAGSVDDMGDGSCAYSIQMNMYMKSQEVRQKPKKLKAGERRNKSFSNDRLRDIERHNQILLNRILNQKPTYVLDEKKKKKDKFSALPPTTRVTSAEINRKKQQRQIDMDNQLLKRKLEAITKRKNKQK